MTIVATNKMEWKTITHKNGVIALMGADKSVFLTREEAAELVEKLSATIQDMDLTEEDVCATCYQV